MKACYRVVHVSASGKTLGYTSLMTKRDAERSAAINNDVAGYGDGTESGPCYIVVQFSSELADDDYKDAYYVQLARDHYGAEVRDNSRADLIEMGRELDAD